VNPSSGLLQSAVVSGYVIYLTWSAMANNPDTACNPSIAQILNITGADAPAISPEQGIILCRTPVIFENDRKS
jgi:hypothetical protein